MDLSLWIKSFGDSGSPLYTAITAEGVQERAEALYAYLQSTNAVSDLTSFLISKGLSKREVEVAVKTSYGISNKELADQLCVSEKTVKGHLTIIYKKTGYKSRYDLMKLHHGLQVESNNRA
jgi:DNA-binding CsgD family transcriptional regulator